MEDRFLPTIRSKWRDWEDWNVTGVGLSILVGGGGGGVSSPPLLYFWGESNKLSLI